MPSSTKPAIAVSEADVEAVRTWARSVPDVVQVWLYGSRARGEPKRPDSDIDLAVRTRGETVAEQQVAYSFAPGRRELQLRHPVHVEWLAPDGSTPTVESGVAADGVLLYRAEQPDAGR